MAMGDLKTLRTLLAERMVKLDIELTDTVIEAVEVAMLSTRDWLAQPEILALIASGLAESGTVEGAALALHRAAVQ